MSVMSMAFPIFVVVVFAVFSISLFSVYIYVNLPPRKTAQPSSARVRPSPSAGRPPARAPQIAGHG